MPNRVDDQRPWTVSLEEMAEIVNLPLAYLRRRAEAGELPVLHAGRRMRFQPDLVQAQLLREMRAERNTDNMPSLTSTLVPLGGVRVDPRVAPLAAGLAIRAGLGDRLIDRGAPAAVRQAQEAAANRGDHYRGISLRDAALEATRLMGVDFGHDFEAFVQAGLSTRASVSTSAMEATFSPLVNIGIEAAYAEADDSTEGWTRTVEATDFKERTAARVGPMSDLRKLARGNIARHATRGDQAETYRIHRYAQQVVIDEQDIIDDRLDVLVETPREIGRAAARVRPDLVYYLMLANPAMADSEDLFSAAHGNVGTAALAADALEAAIAAMGAQVDEVDGNNVQLNLRAQTLVVPQDLAFRARQLINSSEIRGDRASDGTRNVLRDENLHVRSDNRLGAGGVTDPDTRQHVAGSSTNWFLGAARPNLEIEVAYLRGTERKPDVRMKLLDGGQYGIGYDVKLDVGVGLAGYRGLYKSTGAA